MKQEQKRIKEKTGKLTAVGTQITKESSTMFIEIDKQRIWIEPTDIITIIIK